MEHPTCTPNFGERLPNTPMPTPPHAARHGMAGCEELKGLVFLEPLVRTVQSGRRLEAMSSLTSISLARSRAVTPEAIRALTR